MFGDLGFQEMIVILLLVRALERRSENFKKSLAKGDAEDTIKIAGK